MITLLILFAVFATAAVTISLCMLALVVFLWRERKEALKGAETISAAYQTLLVERAFLIAREQANQPLWNYKSGATLH